MKESTTTCVNLFADNSSNARSAAYLYNPAGQLLSETTYNDLGTVQQTKHYIWLGTVPIAMLQPAANDTDDRVIYLHPDHLDTPRKATNQNQQLVWQWQSDAFGQTAANDDPDSDGSITTINLRFPGQYYDVETGLHYNYFRDYDPGMGRYMQSDPIGTDGGLNTYWYVASSPLRNVDIYGLFLCDWLAQLGDNEITLGITFGAGVSFNESLTLSASGLTGGVSVGVGAGVSGRAVVGSESGSSVSTNLWRGSVGDTGRSVNVDTNIVAALGKGIRGVSLEGKVGTSGASASVDAGLIGGSSLHVGIGVSGKFLDCPEDEESDSDCKP